MADIERTTNKVITLTADFGDNFALAQVGLVISSINPEAKFMVISNNVTPFSILEGAFLLAKSCTYSPKESIHIAVVDPGVGTGRRGILLKTRNHWFVGPDNGLLYPAATEDGIEEAYCLDESLLNRRHSNTFHGRDIFAPAAARISLGEPPLNFAIPISPDTVRPYCLEPDQVGHIDPYGNAKLTISPEGYKPGDRLCIDFTTGRISIPYCRTFADVPKGGLLAYWGSNDTLEIAQNLGSAAKTLNLTVGDKLRISREEAIREC